MNIVFINQPQGVVMPSEGPIGSIAIGLNERSRRLAEHHRVTVYCRARERWHDIRIEHKNGVEFRGIPSKMDKWWNGHIATPLYERQQRVERKLGKGCPDHPYFAYRLNHLDYARRIANDLQHIEPDIVHIHMFFQAILAVRAKYPRARILFHVHGEELAQLDPRPIERYLRQADLIIGVSDYITRGLQRNFPRLADRCRTLPNGVDVDEAAPIYEYNRNSYGAERLIFVSRISPEKGVHTLIEAFNLLGAECMGTCLELVGPQKAMSQARLSALLHPDQMKTMEPFYNGKTYFQVLTERVDPTLVARVSFTGHIPHEQVMDRFRDAYVLIQPSISEALGNAPLEAMACGVPVIGTMTGGIPEAVVDGETGFLVPPGDARALANAILALLHDPARQRTMRDKARQRAVSQFSWDKVVNDLNSLYEEVSPH